MGNVKFFAAVAVLALLSGALWAATGEPVLEISSYSTVPSTAYPGTMGYLQVTFENTGDAAAKSVTARYEIDGVGGTVSSGDISAGSSSQMSIPFKILGETGGTIQVVSASIYYNYDSGSSGVASKQTSISVPITVMQQEPLEIRTAGDGPRTVSPGGDLRLALELRNTGGVVNNLVISMPDNSTFALDGTSQERVGSVPANSTRSVNLTLVASSSTASGTYGIPVIFTYQDALKQPTSSTEYVGPVSVVDASSQYRLTLEPVGVAEIGSETEFLLTLENSGNSVVSGTISINSTDVFTPIGMQDVYFDSLQPGKKATAKITLGVSSSSGAGYYTLPIRLSTSSGQSAAFRAGISVSATPELTLKVSSSGGAAQLEIANTGNTQIRSVYVKARMAGETAYAESFLGTLNVDDYATLQLSSQASSAGLFGSQKLVEVEISFRDSKNSQHVLKETVSADGLVLGADTGTAGLAAGNRSAGFATNQAGRGVGGGLFGMLTGPGSTRQATGFNAIPIIIVAALLVAAYLAYRFWWKKRAKPQQMPHVLGQQAGGAKAQPPSMAGKGGRQK